MRKSEMGRHGGRNPKELGDAWATTPGSTERGAAGVLAERRQNDMGCKYMLQIRKRTVIIPGPTPVSRATPGRVKFKSQVVSRLVRRARASARRRRRCSRRPGARIFGGRHPKRPAGKERCRDDGVRCTQGKGTGNAHLPMFQHRNLTDDSPPGKRRLQGRAVRRRHRPLHHRAPRRQGRRHVPPQPRRRVLETRQVRTSSLLASSSRAHC